MKEYNQNWLLLSVNTKKNLVNNMDLLIQNIQTDFSKNIKWNETVKRDKGCVILKEKQLVKTFTSYW